MRTRPRDYMNFNKVYFIIIFILFIVINNNAFAQLTVIPSISAPTLASTLAGPGVTILNPVDTCPGVANGIFTATGTLLAMSNGIVLTNGHSAACVGPWGAPPGTASFNDGAPGDPQMAQFLPAGIATHDACMIEFDVVATGDSIGFNYQFGSQEYYNAVCGIYSDVFAFFISGPGIVGAPNMALVPGTNIPVEVNSVNDGIVGGEGTDMLSNCTSLGAGSPFTAYYINNIGGTQMSYTGYTTKFRAIHAVTPCDTYHLKLSIVDAGNSIYDSGVFLEGGSLTSNTYSINHSDSIGATINGISNTIVKGCSPTTVVIDAGHVNTTATTLYLSFGGTAINGADVVTIPDTVILPADSTSVSINVQGIATALGGTKVFTIYLDGICGIIDSVSINILDTPFAYILTPDTAVCSGQSFQIQVASSAGLSYNWSPAAGLNSATLMEPICTPTVNTTYTMVANLPGSGCPPDTSMINVSITNIGIAILTPDTSLCLGQSVIIRVNGSDSFSYVWTPSTGLDSIHVKEPLATPDITTTYIVNATSPGGCTTSEDVTISVVSISASVFTPDTAICIGQSVQVMASATSSLTYQWLPTAGISISNILDPLITPDTSATYYLTGALPGCSEIMDSIKIDVQPYPVIYLTGSLSVCKYDTLHITVEVSPQWYTHYIYNWSPAINLDNSSSSTVVFTAGDTTNLIVAVSTPAGCSATDSTKLIVHNIDTIFINDTNVCPHDSIQFIPTTSDTSLSYQWHPAMYLSDSNATNPWVFAITSQSYWAVATNQYGCHDTISVNVNVHPAAIITLADSVTIYPGGSYQITPQTNCTGFSWFPSAGLNDAYISNPIAMPVINTKYIVTGATEWGCITTDSIDIYLGNTLLAIPNAFTPGNGPNNLLKILINGIGTLNYLRIYNRWGNLVYDSKDIDAGWDGTYNGIPQPMGVFVYELEAITNEGVIFKQHGNVTLIR